MGRRKIYHTVEEQRQANRFYQKKWRARQQRWAKIGKKVEKENPNELARLPALQE